MTDAYIGSVTFEFPLKWIDKNDPVVMGVDVRTRSGDMVMVRTADVSQSNRTARLKYEWIPFEDLETLKYYWQSGTTYSADFEGTGEIRTIRFAAKNGVNPGWKHEFFGDEVVHAQMQHGGVSYPQDRYSGELNLIIIS